MPAFASFVYREVARPERLFRSARICPNKSLLLREKVSASRMTPALCLTQASRRMSSHPHFVALLLLSLAPPKPPYLPLPPSPVGVDVLNDPHPHSRTAPPSTSYSPRVRRAHRSRACQRSRTRPSPHLPVSKPPSATPRCEKAPEVLCNS